MSLLKLKKPTLPTPAESRLLNALWDLGTGTVEEIVNYFPESERPNYKTTHTLLRIMESKNYLRHTTRGKVFIFEPIVARNEIAQASVQSLLRQNFGGSASGLLVNLLETQSLKSSDLEKMEDLIRTYRLNRSAQEHAE
ncbi:MAG: BlaI/MecI/CopY family transcriptional regulator [Acidobacteriota bacterium]|nr:BlaI/MecI/CopY family transcriptional regulator [Acidobacteriota bacterium]